MHAVIFNMNTNQKLGTGHENMKPKASILDPEYTYSVAKNQTADARADIVSHIFETYFNHIKGVDIQDNIAEGLLRP